MNLFNISLITNSGELTDEQPISRRDLFSKMADIIKKGTIGSIPFIATGAFTKKAQGRPTDPEVVAVLNYLLQFEFMLELFYVKGVVNEGLIEEPYFKSIRAIKDHHQEHVKHLKRLIVDADLNLQPAPQLTFTFNTKNLNPLNDFDDFLTIAQILEDASTSAYKKYVSKLREFNISNDMQRLLLRVHTAEGRHASYIRLVRSERGTENLTPWISSIINNAVPLQLLDIYQNEENEIQNEIDIPAITDIEVGAVREAWDEPVAGQIPSEARRVPGGIGPLDQLFQLFDARVG